MAIFIRNDVDKDRVLCAVVVVGDIEWRLNGEIGWSVVDRTASSDGFVLDKWMASMYTADVFG